MDKTKVVELSDAEIAHLRKWGSVTIRTSADGVREIVDPFRLSYSPVSILASLRKE